MISPRPAALLLCLLVLLAAPLPALAQDRAGDQEAGESCCGYTVEGYKFFDLDGNGLFDGGDYGLGGWTILAMDTTGTAFDSTATDSTGYWSMLLGTCGIPFRLGESLVPGWNQSYPGGSGEHEVTLTGCGATHGPFNFGNTAPDCLDFARTYTTDADFLEGDLDGVITNSDQLELAPTGTTFEFAWIANAGEGTVSKVHTDTGMEVARYYTGPPIGGGIYTYLSPSRTAIDKDGNCWVANRTMDGRGSVTQILVDGGDDRNANSTIETCFDASANGIIESSEILPWGDDERVVRHYEVGGYAWPDNVPRALAIDKAGYLWVGLYFSQRVIKLDPTLPTSIYGPDMVPTAPPELVSVDLSGAAVYPYGLALSPSGMLYACGGGYACEIDPGIASGGTGAGPAMTQYIDHTDDYNYGIAVDSNCIVWLAKQWPPTPNFGAIRWDPTVGVGNPALGFSLTTPGAPGPGRGITVDFDGNIWVACNDSLNSVAKFDGAGNFLASYPTGLLGIVGVGAASDGHIIVVGSGSWNWAKIDKDTGAVIPLAGPELAGMSPYTYSDFTGSLQNIVSQQQGFWTVITDGGSTGLSWVLVDWTESTPPLTNVQVEYRTGFTLSSLATEPWTILASGGPLGSSAPGRYIETRVRLQRERDCGDPFVTPILYDLTVEAECDSCYIVTCPSDIVQSCDSPSGAVVTFVEPVPNHDCDSTWVMTCTPPSGSLFPIGNTTVVCQGVNASADTLECTFQVTVTGDCVQQSTGACCFGQTACDDVTEEDCLHMGGVYFGDGTDCATIDCGLDCVRPPRGLTAWWPLDDASGGVTPNLADPAGGGTLIGGPVNMVGSYVTASYLFDGSDDYANVPDGPGIDLGTSDFSIDFWIKTTDGQGLNAILDKRSSSPVRGYRMFLQDGYPGLSMADGSIGSYVLSAANGGPAAFVADGSWHLVAVTVDRNDPNGVRFYVDGAPVGTAFNPTAESGSLDNAADLVIGQNYSIITAGGFFTGNLDELEIFRREISATDINDIYRAGTAGKCREVCYASQNVLCCDGEASGAITICNYDVVSHVYSYGLDPLSGAGCAGLGVTSFSPNGGTVTVGPGECLTIPIEMLCPTDVPVGVASCFEAFIYNHDTGAKFGCTGTVRRPAWWCIKWEVASKPAKGLLPVLPQSPVAVNLFIKHIPVLNPAPVTFDYEIWPMEQDGTTPSPAISLNGRAPGQPIVAGPVIPPDGYDTTLSLEVLAHQPLTYQKLVLMGDEDMDGTKEPLAEVALVSDERATVGVDELDPGDVGGGEAPRPFLALPNPFTASGRISFRITGDTAVRVSLQMFDVRGREIKRFYRKFPLEPGVHEVDWKGDNGHGTPLPNGVYFLRLTAPGIEENVKVVLMR